MAETGPQPSDRRRLPPEWGHLFPYHGFPALNYWVLWYKESIIHVDLSSNQTAPGLDREVSPRLAGS